MSLRQAGARWRILVHEWAGRSRGQREGMYGKAHDVTASLSMLGSAERQNVVHLPGTEFDELVIGQWIHLEQMDTGRWWMNIGGVTLWITADRDGRPTRVSVYGPGDYDDPRDGCEYTLTWTADSPDPKAGKR